MVVKLDILEAFDNTGWELSRRILLRRTVNREGEVNYLARINATADVVYRIDNLTTAPVPRTKGTLQGKPSFPLVFQGLHDDGLEDFVRKCAAAARDPSGQHLPPVAVVGGR